MQQRLSAGLCFLIGGLVLAAGAVSAQPPIIETEKSM